MNLCPPSSRLLLVSWKQAHLSTEVESVYTTREEVRTRAKARIPFHTGNRSSSGRSLPRYASRPRSPACKYQSHRSAHRTQQNIPRGVTSAFDESEVRRIRAYWQATLILHLFHELRVFGFTSDVHESLLSPFIEIVGNRIALTRL